MIINSWYGQYKSYPYQKLNADTFGIKTIYQRKHGVQCFIIYLCAVYLKLHTDSFHSSHTEGYEDLLWQDVQTKSSENPPVSAHVSAAKGQTHVYT